MTEILSKMKKKSITVGGTITKFKRNNRVFGEIIEQKKHLIADTYYLIIIVIELRYNILIINFVKFGPKMGNKSHSRVPPKTCFFCNFV